MNKHVDIPIRHLWRPTFLVLIAIAITIDCWLNRLGQTHTFTPGGLNGGMNHQVIMLVGLYALGMVGFLSRRWPDRRCEGKGYMEIDSVDRSIWRRVASGLCMLVGAAFTITI